MVFPAEYKKSRDTDRSRLGTGPSVNQEKATHDCRRWIPPLSFQGGRRCFATCGGGGGGGTADRRPRLLTAYPTGGLCRCTGLTELQPQVYDLATVSRGYLTRALRFPKIWTAGSRQLMYYSAECSFFYKQLLSPPSATFISIPAPTFSRLPPPSLRSKRRLAFVPLRPVPAPSPDLTLSPDSARVHLSCSQGANAALN